MKYEQYFPFFRDEGYSLTIAPFMSNAFWDIAYKQGGFFKKALFTVQGYFSRLLLLTSIHRQTIVYVHLWVTPFGPPLFEYLVCKLAKRLIYDVDDLIHLKEAHRRTNFFAGHLKGRYKPIFLMKHANHVITCTPALDHLAKRFNTRTTDISSTINTSRYRPKQEYHLHSLPVIGWSGSHSTVNFLLEIAEVLREVYYIKKFKLLVIGGEIEIEGLEIECLPWIERSEVDDLKRIDIGVYPLPDTPWVLGKSGLKALQYMALGIPTIATALGANFRIIENDRTGYLAATSEDWKKALLHLLSSEEERQRIGCAAAAFVEKFYSVNANKEKYLSIIEGVTLLRG